jgi:choline monooxygenase
MSLLMPIKISQACLDSIEPVDIDDAYTLPAFMYTDEAFVKIDKQIILSNSWQLVGHTSQLTKSGDQIVAEISDKPVVIVRNKTGDIKAFHNVCRHRAGPVATANGNSPFLSCKYHGWTYTLDGALKSAPEMASTPNFDVCQYHLPQVSLSIWQGLVFINLDNNAVTPEIGDLFSGISETIHPIDIAAMQFSHRQEYKIQCNWKVYMDNYLEGYHLPIVHPGLNKLLDYRSYEITTHPWYIYQYSPLESSSGVNNFYGEGKAHYYCIFPNLMLNILPGRLQTNLVVPVDEKTCKVIFDFYYSDVDSAKTQKIITQDLEFSDQIQVEDISICENVQKGLASGTYEKGRLCIKRENGVLHYQEMLRKTLRNAVKSSQLILSE